MEIKDILEPSEYESLNQFTPDDIEWINVVELILEEMENQV